MNCDVGSYFLDGKRKLLFILMLFRAFVSRRLVATKLAVFLLKSPLMERLDPVEVRTTLNTNVFVHFEFSTNSTCVLLIRPS
jgi:hypothetical protein